MEKSESKAIISESTSVRLSLIVGFLLTFGSAVWWASSISSGLSSVLSQISSFNSSLVELKAADTAFTREIGEIRLQMALRQSALDNLKSKVDAMSNRP